ncbi:MAG TPA: YdeI/OmpD-associated family protein, partial [Solirubrobacteraceae bacterium]
PLPCLRVTAQPIFFDSPAEWRAWLEQHHDTETEVWVGLYKKASGKVTMTWSQAVDEALCFGWIDSVSRRVDDDSRMQRFSPRKAKSHWSKVNVAKVEALRAAGKMTPAGEAAFAARSEENTGRASFERDEPAAFTPEQEAALRADAAAWEWFSAQAPYYRRTATHWVVSAKREETRARRLATLIACSAVGERVPPLKR